MALVSGRHAAWVLVNNLNKMAEGPTCDIGMLHQCLQAPHRPQQLLQVSLVSSLLLLHLSAPLRHLCHLGLQGVAGLADILVLSVASCQLQVQAIPLLGRGVQCCLQGQGAGDCFFDCASRVSEPASELYHWLQGLASTRLLLSAEAAGLFAEDTTSKHEAEEPAESLPVPTLHCKEGTPPQSASHEVIPLRVAAAL